MATTPTPGTVQIVTDSTSDLPPETARDLGITVVPLYIFFGEESYRDNVDITPDAFYARLTTEKVFPRTSQPTPADFTTVYREAVQRGPVLSLHVSSKVSGTHNSALLARDEVLRETPDAQIEVVDTFLVAMGLGNLVTGAAQRVSEGASLAEATSWARSVADRTRIIFGLDTLEYLVRGGRIGRAQGFIGSLLNVKPLLEIRDGEVHPLERVRTKKRAMERLLQNVLDLGDRVESVVVATSTDIPAATAVADRLREALGQAEVPVFRIGPVVGTYAGPGCVGISVVVKDEGGG